MARIPDSILSAPRRLTREEFQRITEHPAHTRDILREAGPQFHDIAEIAYQEHEREMGQGYPLGLRGEQIAELAKIVGVADVYEACTHARTYRRTFIPYEALQELIEMRGQHFHPRYIKALMNALTVYLLESYVQLNTGETGRVLATNRTNLMRPIVELLWNARGERLATPKMVDLAETPFLFVSKPLSEELLPRSSR
jgi:HD-GYP domain-containing protein (c-di-GMP phosphodiesterase class II)